MGATNDIPGTSRKEALKHLQELYLKNQISKSSNFPAAYIPKYSYNDKTANGLTKCVIDFIKFNGGQAERISSAGRVIDERRTYTNALGQARTMGSAKYIPTTGTRGTADISATINGRSVKIEVKIGTDRQSQFQKEYQKSIEASGGIYFIARTFESFYTWFTQTFKTNTSL